MLDPRHRLDLYLSHRAGLVDYATPIVGSRAGAEDVVQEAWLRFIGSEGSLSQPVAYLYRIVRNLALDHLRRDRNSQPVELDWLEDLPDEAPGPEAHAVSHDELTRVNLALQQLPERTRLAFQLYRLQGLTLQQVADNLEMSVGTAHQLVHSTLRYLAEVLGRNPL